MFLHSTKPGNFPYSQALSKALTLPNSDPA